MHYPNLMPHDRQQDAVQSFCERCGREIYRDSASSICEKCQKSGLTAEGIVKAMLEIYEAKMNAAAEQEDLPTVRYWVGYVDALRNIRRKLEEATA